MKKRDFMLGGCVCLLAAIIWIFSQFFWPKENNQIRITVNGEVYGEYTLKEDQVIPIGDTNICEISDGKVKMTEADCPDQLCVHQKAVDAAGGTIVCLPNKVVIEALSDSSGNNSDIDAVAS